MSSAIRNPWTALAVIALLAGCQTTGGESPPASGDAAPPVAEARLTGTVSYRERMALPPDATVEVRLEDVSQADAPAALIAEQRIEVDGRQVPIPFELAYPLDRIEMNRRYALRAEIRGADGTLLFTTVTRHAALVEGEATQDIAIQLERVAIPPAAGNPLIGDWRLVAIQRPGAEQQTVGPEPPHTMTFGADGRVTGKAHCNSYSAGYEQPGAGQLRIENAISTLMACLPPSRADEFLGAIGGVTGYQIEGDVLELAYTGGGALKLKRGSAAAEQAPQAGKPWTDAAARGVSFRALGNEPAWVLEIAGRQATIFTDLGERKTEFKLAEPVVKGDTTIWRSAGGGEGLVAVVQRRQCVDDMSGEPMEANAAVTFESVTYKGCGRFLE
ncbi:MAG: YbaY family lipoprotein [Steroidobacteraceae bacterium]